MILPTKTMLLGTMMMAMGSACSGNTGDASKASSSGPAQTTTTGSGTGSGGDAAAAITSGTGGTTSSDGSATDAAGATTTNSGSAGSGAATVGGSGGATTSDGAGGSAGAGACANFDPVVPADQVALAGRPDADAEILALRASQAIVAPTALYDRIRTDLAAIRVLEPSLADVHAFDHLYGSVGLSVDEETFQAVEQGEFDAWDCVNAHYGATPSITNGTVGLDFGSKRYLTLRLVRDEYATLPGIAGAFYSVVDTPDVCLVITDDDHRYLFDVGSSCGNEGCLKHDYSAFDVSPAGQVSPVGTYCTQNLTEAPCDDSAPEPDWLAPLKATCHYESLSSR